MFHLLKPRVCVGWIEPRQLKSSSQNLEKAFVGRKKFINRQKRGLKVAVPGCICTAIDDPRDEAFKISHRYRPVR